MAYSTKIQWTDSTWNPITGCRKVSDGCKHCYAERFKWRFGKGREFSDITIHHDRMDQPLHWKKPRRVFVCSMSDLFQDDVPIHRVLMVLRVVSQCPQHTFQILTKRSKRMRGIMSTMFDPGEVPNLWLGVSVENQDNDERIHHLLKTPVAVRFVSYEPALGPLGLFDHGPDRTIQWVVAGGETGPRNRWADPDWFRDVRDQCRRMGVPFFMKQMSGGRAIPPDLCIREFAS